MSWGVVDQRENLIKTSLRKRVLFVVLAAALLVVAQPCSTLESGPLRFMPCLVAVSRFVHRFFHLRIVMISDCRITRC